MRWPAPSTGGWCFPETATAPRARRLFQPRYDALTPGAVAYPARAADLAVCPDFARRSAAAVVPRGGGHGYAGWSSRGGGLSSTPEPLRKWRWRGTA